jgi:hypothetical protein
MTADRSVTIWLTREHVTAADLCVLLSFLCRQGFTHEEQVYGLITWSHLFRKFLARDWSANSRHLIRRCENLRFLLDTVRAGVKQMDTMQWPRWASLWLSTKVAAVLSLSIGLCIRQSSQSDADVGANTAGKYNRCKLSVYCSRSLNPSCRLVPTDCPMDFSKNGSASRLLRAPSGTFLPLKALW